MAASPQPPAWTFTMLSNDKLPLLHPQLPLQKNHHCDRSPPSLSARSAAGLSTGSCWKHCVAKHLDILTMFQCWTCNRQHRMFLGLASSSTWPGANPPAAEVLNMEIIEPVSDVIHEENLWAKCPQQPGLPPTGCLLQLSQGRHREEAPKIKHLNTLNQRCNWHCYLLPITLNDCYITISPPCQDRHTMCWRSCVSSFIEFLVNFPLSIFQHWYQSAAEGASSQMNYGTCMLAGVAVQALSRGHQSTSECLRFAQENISQIKKLKTWEIMDFYRTSKLISATLGVSRTIYVNVDSPYLGFHTLTF